MPDYIVECVNCGQESILSSHKDLKKGDTTGLHMNQCNQCGETEMKVKRKLGSDDRTKMKKGDHSGKR